MSRFSGGNDEQDRDANVDDFVAYDDVKISWSRDLKRT